jgi:hypothetical protein
MNHQRVEWQARAVTGIVDTPTPISIIIIIIIIIILVHLKIILPTRTSHRYLRWTPFSRPMSLSPSMYRP